MEKLVNLLNPALIQKAELLEAMSASASSRLPAEMAGHLWVGGYEAGYLALYTDLPHYAIYIRAHQREILKQIKEEFKDQLPKNIKMVRIRVTSR